MSRKPLSVVILSTAVLGALGFLLVPPFREPALSSGDSVDRPPPQGLPLVREGDGSRPAVPRTGGTPEEGAPTAAPPSSTLSERLEDRGVLGRVTGPFGQGIPGAEIEAWSPRDGWHPADLSLETRSGEGGRFRLALPPGRIWTFYIRHPDFAPLGPAGRCDSLQPGWRTLPPFRLRSGFGLAGIVRTGGSEGPPLAGVRVRIRRSLLPESGPFSGKTEERTTDAGGGFRIQGLEPGEYRIELFPPEPFAPLSIPAWKAAPTETLSPRILVLRRGYRLEGRVRWPEFRDSSGPVDLVLELNAEVLKDAVPDLPRLRCPLDPRGRWSFPSVPEGTYILRVLPEGSAIPLLIRSGVRVPGMGFLDLVIRGGPKLKIRFRGEAPVGRLFLRNPRPSPSVPPRRIPIRFHRTGSDWIPDSLPSGRFRLEIRASKSSVLWSPVLDSRNLPEALVLEVPALPTGRIEGTFPEAVALRIRVLSGETPPTAWTWSSEPIRLPLGPGGRLPPVLVPAGRLRIRLLDRGGAVRSLPDLDLRPGERRRLPPLGGSSSR